ncbi:hypothetical protein ACFL6P_05405 [Candidatus Latescibacterota bacterium]
MGYYGLNLSIIKLYLHLLILCALTCPPCFAEDLLCSKNDSGVKEAHSQSYDRSHYQTSIGYWNDNLIFKEFFGQNVNQGNDDYITASFWLQVARVSSDNNWIVDVYHNTLTNKDQKIRTDLLSFRVSIEKETSFGIFQAGSGMISSGNFGGKDIQNAYHDMAGIDRVNLPYTDKRHSGFLAFIKYKPLIWEKDRVRIRGYSTLSHRTSIGPSNVRAGLDFNLVDKKLLKSYIIHIQSRIGYIDYYRTLKYLTPLFDKGYTWDFQCSLGSIDSSHIAFWITSNQYGKNQPHFGISYTFSWNGERLADLSDISFP